MEPEQSNSSWSILAGVRFILASIVVVAHIMTNVGSPAWVVSIASLGAFGSVIGFLVISGYSIAASLERNTTEFYERRFWRIAPIYLVCLIIAQTPWALYGPIVKIPMQTYEAPEGILSLLLNAFCLQTWLTPPVITFNPSWSLAVEVFFYGIAPWLFRLSTKTLSLLIGGSMLAYLAHQWYGQVNYWAELHGVSVLCLGWAWIGGFLFYRHRTNANAKIVLIVACVILVQLNQFAAETRSTITMVFVATSLAQGTFVLISYQVSRVLNWLGDVSYPLYLVHFPVLIYSAKYGMGALPALIVSYIAAIIVYYSVDLPLRAYVKRRNLAIHSKRISHQRANLATRENTVPDINIS